MGVLRAPIGVEASTSGLANPCAIGTNVMNLSGGQSCSVDVKLPSVDAVNFGFVDWSGQYLMTNLPFSYTDDYYGFVVDEDVLATRYSVIYSNWLKGFSASFVSCTELDSPETSLSGQWRYAIKLNAGFSFGDYGVTYPISVRSELSVNGILQTAVTSCKINAGQSSCELDIPDLPVAIPGDKELTAMIFATDAKGNAQRTPFSFNLGNLCRIP